MKTDGIAILRLVCLGGILFLGLGGFVVHDWKHKQKEPITGEGTLTVNVSRLLVPRVAEKLGIGISTTGARFGKSVQVPWIDRDGYYLKAFFSNVTATQPVLITVRNQNTTSIECILTFTVQQLADSGILSTPTIHNPPKLCSMLMTVNWTRDV